jgi:hypothetical protein
MHNIFFPKSHLIEQIANQNETFYTVLSRMSYIMLSSMFIFPPFSFQSQYDFPVNELFVLRLIARIVHILSNFRTLTFYLFFSTNNINSKVLNMHYIIKHVTVVLLNTLFYLTLMYCSHYVVEYLARFIKRNFPF